MGKFGEELIESMQQAARHAAGKKVAKGFKLHRRSFATAQLSDEQAKTVESSCMGEQDALKTK
jgi:hypothetical protein